MPIYQLRCAGGHSFEVIQSLHEPLPACAHCGGDTALGLRPKMAVFAAASAYAAATGSQSLYAVSNLTHTINADA